MTENLGKLERVDIYNVPTILISEAIRKRNFTRDLGRMQMSDCTFNGELLNTK